MDYFPNLNDILHLKDILYHEYFLIKDNKIFKIIVEKNENKIIIRSNNNLISLKLKDISSLTKKNFNSIEMAYKFIINIFDNDNVIIKDFIIKKEIILKLVLNNENEIEIKLLYNKENISNIIYEIYKIKNDINNLKNENNKLKKEIDLLKAYHDNPKNIELLSNITSGSYSDFDIDKIFTVFKSINDILYLIYSNQYKSIICYDLRKQNIVNILKKCHNEYITNLSHYLDKNNKMDLIMSISSADNRIRLWNVNNWDCLLDISKINESSFLFSACFLYEKKQNYIITSHCNWLGNSEPIKIFDFNGNKIKEIRDSNEKTYFIDTYYDDISSKYYIITGNMNYIKSYDYNTNELYHKYYDNYDNKCHLSIIIKNNEKIIKLIESCQDGNIRIWNFHSGLLLSKIKINNRILYGICLWGNFLFVGCEDKTIKLIDLKMGITIKSLIGHNNRVLSIKKINHPKYGECIISQGWKHDQIRIWLNKK